MTLRILTALLIALFLSYLVRHRLRQRRLRQAGLPVEKPQGLRPITILALLMLGMYAGYLLFHFISR